MAKVEHIVNHFWNPPPSDGTGPYTITLAQGSDTTEMGALLMQLSPPEYCWAPVIAIAKAIHDGVGDDVLELYRACLLNTPLRIEIYDNAQDRLWRAHQLRQDEAQKGIVAKPTPIQMIMDIVEAKKMLERNVNGKLGIHVQFLIFETHPNEATHTA